MVTSRSQPDSRPISEASETASEQERALRVDLAAAYRLVAHYGWDDLIFTHISVRIPGPEHHFLINPYGMLFEEITASSLVRIDLQGNKIGASPWPVNPAGFTIHSAVHEVRDDAQCVMHLHTVDGTAVASTEGGLLPLNQTAMLVRDQIAYHEFEGVAVDLDERPRLQRDLGDKSLMLLWNHGTLSVGRTVAEAFVRMYLLERACQMQVRTLTMSGAKTHPVQQPVIARTAAQGAEEDMTTMVINQLAWPALRRKLDRLDPTYQD